MTGLARNSLRILAAEGHDIAEVTGRLNRLILNEGTRGRFITLLHGEIRLEGPGKPARLSLVCAGHPPPLLLRAAGEPVRACRSRRPAPSCCSASPATPPSRPTRSRCTPVTC